MGTPAAPGPLRGLNQGSSPNSGPDARSHPKEPAGPGVGAQSAHQTALHDAEGPQVVGSLSQGSVWRLGGMRSVMGSIVTPPPKFICRSPNPQRDRAWRQGLCKNNEVKMRSLEWA